MGVFRIRYLEDVRCGKEVRLTVVKTNESVLFCLVPVCPDILYILPSLLSPLRRPILCVSGKLLLGRCRALDMGNNIGVPALPFPTA